MSEKNAKVMIGLARLGFTAWAGGQWVVGYAVAPLLFARLERMTAGAIAGELFQGIAWGGLVVALWLLVLRRRVTGWRGYALLGILILSAVSLFALQPMMADLKAAGLGNAETAQAFARLHGVSSVLYLIQSLLAAALAFAGPLERQSSSRGTLSEGR